MGGGIGSTTPLRGAPKSIMPEEGVNDELRYGNLGQAQAPFRRLACDDQRVEQLPTIIGQSGGAVVSSQRANDGRDG